jgi:hypothetical protein
MATFLSALISFSMLMLVLHTVDDATKRRLVGYINPFDVAMHITIFAMSGEASHAKLAAQLAGVMVTITLRTWRHLYGYERLGWSGWTRYAGVLTGRERSTT